MRDAAVDCLQKMENVEAALQSLAVVSIDLSVIMFLASAASAAYC